VRRSGVLLSFLFIAAPAWAAKHPLDSRLVGSWGLAGESVYTFKADGSGSGMEEPFRWSADGKTLTLNGEEGGEDKMGYQLKGDQLVLKSGFLPITFQRIGPPPKAPQSAKPGEQKSDAPKAKAANSGKERDRLSQLLLSSPWCSFSYNKISGATQTRRVQFFENGTWSDAGRSEGYSSGSGGTMASQYDSESGGRWKVESGQLYLSAGSAALAGVDLQVKKNSNGYPILLADGVEYSQCR
jgi:hypothetical protein